MTEDITTNKGTNSVYEYSNSFDVSVNNNNIDSNVLLCNKLNGEISGHSESGTCSGVNDKKSFHITSVTVQHNSTDGNADESADESRTEDLSDNIDMSAVDVQTDVSNLTDNLIRKDDVLYRVTSVGSAPIIPTSAQYGIAVVSNCSTELSDNTKFVPNDGKLSDPTKRSEFMPNGLEINSSIVAKDLNTQIKNERFKVVKIESNEPFKRGRWVCMDFSDQSMDQLKKSAISISDNEKCLKKDTPDKETSPSELLINGIVMENASTTKDACSNIETDKVMQNAQVNESSNYHNGDISGMNSVSPNQTFNASFVPPSNVNQQQAQSLTHIIIPQGTSTQVASGSYGHSQSLPHSELQHVHHSTAQQQQQQQQPQQQQQVHVVSSLQQSFHPHTSLQHQGLLSQGTCPVSNMQHLPTQQQQSDTVYNQSTQSTIPIQQSQQQQPLLQQQYQTMSQSGLNPPPQQCNNQRGPSNTQQQPQPQLPPSNPHCISQMPSQPSQQTVQTNSNESMVNGQQSIPQTNQQAPVQTQFQPNQAQGQQLQHSIQQVPIQQQTFQHPVTQQSSQQPLMHQMPSQHHSPQQQTNQSVQSMPTQQITQTSSNQTSSQTSLPANIQQPVLQPGVSHSLPQQQTVPPAAVQSSVQFLPQQQSVIQSTQQPAQQVMNQSVQPQQIIQQIQGSTDSQIHIPVQQIQQNSQTLHQTQSLSQSTQQQQQQPSQQIMPQQMSSQMQQSQPQISHQQQMQHIPQQQIQQTQVQHPNQQPISQSSQPTQQLTMQPQSLQQQIPHHQQIIQSVPQQQQQSQQPQQQPPPQQIMQTQIQQSQNMSQSSVQSNSFQNSPQQTMSQPSQQSQQQPVQNQVMQQCVQTQQIPPIQQSLPQPSHSIQSSQQLQQPVQSTQSIQHSFPQPVHAPVQTQQMPPQSINGSQTIQQPYQSSVTHQNVPSQINDQNIPVSSTQTYQHDVVLSNVNQSDVMVQNQYPLGQNISIQTQLPLHVSLHQPYQNTGSSNYVNASNMNLMTNTSMASQQTPPISQQQYFNHSVSQSIPHSVQSTGSVTSQDLQQLAHHQGISTMTQSQSGTVNPNVSSLNTPLISTVSSQNLPMTDYLPQQTSNAQNSQIIGQQHSQNVNNSCQIPYSVHSQNVYQQNGIVSQTSSSVQTQTTPISQPCSTSGILQQYAVPQSVPSVLSSVQVPGSSSYLPNIGSVHSNQLQQNYIHNVSMPGSQIYSGGPNPSNVSFADVVASSEQHNLQHVHFPEQVSDNVKISEDVNFHRQEDAENTAGGSNAVAIDNKIEQAMDLVKSHLMFAVREEVEVLKEKIAELMDRINQLEIENSILKANASQETLAQLPTHTPAPLPAISTTISTQAQTATGPANNQPP